MEPDAPSHNLNFAHGIFQQREPAKIPPVDAASVLQRLNFPGSCSHKFPDIPNTHPLVPARTGSPPFRPKQTPIHPAHEFRMSPHHAQFSAATIFWQSFRTPIRPDSTAHVITRTQQRIRQMRTPCDPSDRVSVSLEDGQRTGVWLADVECTDQTVDAGGGDDGAAVFVPVVG